MDDPKVVWQSIDWGADTGVDDWSESTIRQSLQRRSGDLFRQLQLALRRHVWYNAFLLALPVALLPVDASNPQWIILMGLFIGYFGWQTWMTYRQWTLSRTQADYSRAPIALIRSVLHLISTHNRLNRKSLTFMLPASVILGASASMILKDEFPQFFWEKPRLALMILALAALYIPLGRWLTRFLCRKSRFAKIVAALRETLSELEALEQTV